MFNYIKSFFKHRQIKTLSNRYSGDVRNGKRTSEELGLVDLGSDRGSFVVAVGYSREAPDIAIKVVSLCDTWLEYAEKIHKKEFVGPNYPEIHAITYLDDCAVVLMERLYISYMGGYKRDFRGFSTTVYESQYYGNGDEHTCEVADATAALRNWVEKSASLEWDLHSGNLMWREDGTLVLIDPVWRP